MAVGEQSLPLVKLLAARLTADDNLADSVRIIKHEALPRNITGHILFCKVTLKCEQSLNRFNSNCFRYISYRSSFRLSFRAVFAVVTMNRRFLFLNFLQFNLSSP
jgi:hypothetical protein